MSMSFFFCSVGSQMLKIEQGPPTELGLGIGTLNSRERYSPAANINQVWGGQFEEERERVASHNNNRQAHLTAFRRPGTNQPTNQ
jgi:hypothetical protein